MITINYDLDNNITVSNQYIISENTTALHIVEYIKETLASFNNCSEVWIEDNLDRYDCDCFELQDALDPDTTLLLDFVCDCNLI